MGLPINGTGTYCSGASLGVAQGGTRRTRRMRWRSRCATCKTKNFGGDLRYRQSREMEHRERCERGGMLRPAQMQKVLGSSQRDEPAAFIDGIDGARVAGSRTFFHSFS